MKAPTYKVSSGAPVEGGGEEFAVSLYYPKIGGKPRTFQTRAAAGGEAKEAVAGMALAALHEAQHQLQARGFGKSKIFSHTAKNKSFVMRKLKLANGGGGMASDRAGSMLTQRNVF